jgi:hypothetical protein
LSKPPTHFELVPLEIVKKRAREYATVHRRGLRKQRNYKYPWQQSVLDALAAPPELLQRKIAKAERAIAAQLRQYDPDETESLALKSALRTLRARGCL